MQLFERDNCGDPGVAEAIHAALNSSDAVQAEETYMRCERSDVVSNAPLHTVSYNLAHFIDCNRPTGPECMERVSG